MSQSREARRGGGGEKSEQENEDGQRGVTESLSALEKVSLVCPLSQNGGGFAAAWHPATTHTFTGRRTEKKGERRCRRKMIRGQ